MPSTNAARRADFAFALACVLPIVLLATAGAALARGGGGGGFDGGGGGGGGGGAGGSGGGGGGGDGGGDGSGIGELIWLIVRYPKVGVPVVVVLLVIGAVGKRKGQAAYQGRVIRRGGEALLGNRRDAALASLRARDPAFDDAAFLARTRTAFAKVQAAWCSHDLTPMRPFVSDGIHERFALQTKEQEELGYRDRMDDLHVLGAELARVVTQRPFDVVTVALHATAKDYRVRLADGTKIRGTDAPEEFVEYWTFQRRTGGSTKPGSAGLIEGRCPNCGAAIELNQWSACTYCRAILRSGEFDWVLTEITQASEWRDTPDAAVPGLDALRAKDPGFDLQHLEDRASVMFWRLAMSERLGSVGPVRKIASPEFAAAFARRLAGDADDDGTRSFVGERAVGSVDTCGFTTADGFDRALVDVRWQGTRFAAKPSAAPERGEKLPTLATLLELARRSDAKSDADASVASAHCPRCGAPELGGATNACEFCGEVMNDGRRDWVLERVFLRTSEEGEAALAALVPRVGAAGGAGAEGEAPVAARPPVRRACVAWLARTMWADGEPDPREREVLEGVAEKAGMRRAELEDAIAGASAAGDGAVVGPGPADVAEARAWLDVMAEVALADGRISPPEASLLLELGAAHGLARADVGLVCAQAKTRLYRQAKAALEARCATSAGG